MTTRKNRNEGKVDKVRASRDGHEYHEVWTARKATQLLWPDSELKAIAIEGLSPHDQSNASSDTIEIADLTYYFGDGANFESASQVVIAQFKYSVSYKDDEYRASHAKKTIEKFVDSYKSYRRKYGAKVVQEKLRFEIVTNRPICQYFLEALNSLSSDEENTGDVKRQAGLIRKYTKLSGKPLIEFSKKLKVIGLTGNLPGIKGDLTRQLIDWSATSDPIASARLGELVGLVRDKAGYAGTNNNVISRTDILAALKIGDPSDLLPCEAALADFGKILEREQFSEALVQIDKSSKPILIHATGGVGKTVFLDSLASKMAENHEVFFFDCFGGGAYRSPEDSRHLPNKGLLHIVNSLAFRGLCDPILPDVSDTQSLLKTFRRRILQCIETIGRIASGRKLTIFIDAIDNAEFAAKQQGEDCFPIKLLESLHEKPISDLKLIVSCRTERKPKTYSEYQDFELLPFSKVETTIFLKSRLKKVSNIEINVAQSRSSGNARVLEYLVKTDRNLLDESEIENEIVLDDLIKQRITEAISDALRRGYSENNISTFLAGLAVLPPPVPLDEYAGVHGIDINAIESFASDLWPLLERTQQGLMFRDEPTETFVQQAYASNASTLKKLASNLLERQDQSVYAARALPRLLKELDDEEQLLKLAFDERIPSSITGTVGKRNIRYARLKSAISLSASKRNYNSLVKLFVELSTIAATDHRGTEYILSHPDLVVAANDVDAMRRLFEVRTGWPGTRHARLTTAYALSGLTEEAYRHFNGVQEWISHHYRSKSDDHHREQGPDREDIASVPFFLVIEGQTERAIKYLKHWKDWYTFEVCENIFRYSLLAQRKGVLTSRIFSRFIDEMDSIGSLTSSLSLLNLSRDKQKNLLLKLSKSCNKKAIIDLPHRTHHYSDCYFEDGLRKSVTISVSLGLKSEAKRIFSLMSGARPNLWCFRDSYYSREVFNYIFQVAFYAVVMDKSIHEKDVLPKDIYPILNRVKNSLKGDGFKKKSISKLEAYRSVSAGKKDRKESSLSYEECEKAKKFVSRDLEVVFNFTNSMSAMLKSSSRSIDKHFLAFLDIWEKYSKTKNSYHHYDNSCRFYDWLGRDIAMFFIWSRPNIKSSSISRFLETAESRGITDSDRIRIVEILSQNKHTHDLAGQEALKARVQIEKEADINSRAELFGRLSRAILPASVGEASTYFKDGLDQMDAIGSGDYQFTNELLLFTSQLKGQELDEHDFHTLSNICELNIGEESEKFYWGAYGRGLSKASGLRGLAKISRWDDRNKISLKNTLLPYLIGLLEAGKINPTDALSINRLANPVEYYYSGTKEFAEAIFSHKDFNDEVLLELINQFQDDNSGMAMPETAEYLGVLAGKTLGNGNEVTKNLSGASKIYKMSRDISNNRSNYREDRPDEIERKLEVEKERIEDQIALDKIARSTDPLDEHALVDAVEALSSAHNTYEIKAEFFKKLRAKVPFDQRSEYLKNVANLENLFFYWKFAELNDAKNEWVASTASLSEALEGLAVPLVSSHALDLIDDDRLSGSSIKEISDLTGIPSHDLILELAKIASSPDYSVSGAVWMAFATFMCGAADDGEGQMALKRLLDSDSARLANSVEDGEWSSDLYPKNEEVEVFSGLVWRMLGASSAIDRWRAAHSIRSFARFGRWDVITAIVRLFYKSDGGSFQAKEIPFFYLHARLWLIIALVRLAIDYPYEVAKYKELLFSVLREEKPHSLMQYFASQALTNCRKLKAVELSTSDACLLKSANSSPYPHLKEKIRVGGGFYSGRPESEGETSDKFSLGYDFSKNNVDNLGRVFGQPHWKVSDLIAECANEIDPTVDSMYESGGREVPYNRRSDDIDSESHTLGQQIGYHALFRAAAHFLNKYPITEDSYYDDPWEDWLGRYKCTRDDGLWLSDGTDRTPLDIHEFLLERNGKELGITGDKEKLLKLLNIQASLKKQVVIQGRWKSADGITVKVSSALVSRKKSNRVIKGLIDQDPINVWLPSYSSDEYGDGEYFRDDDQECDPWVVSSSGEARLDEYDPYGVIEANNRYRMSSEINNLLDLKQIDEFGRTWVDNKNILRISSQAWGRRNKYHEDGDKTGSRLLISKFSLKKVLEKLDKELVLLVDLERYEKSGYQRDSRFSHTIAVVHVTQDLEYDYFQGKVNHINKSIW